MKEKVKKIKIDDSPESMVEFARGEFTPHVEKSYKEILTECDYGEIIIKVVDGDIQSVRVVKNYQPKSLD